MSAQLAQRQLALIESCEPAAYHDDGRAGYFAMLVSDGNRKRQHCYPLESMHLVLQAVDRSRDAWISQAEFYAPTRCLVHLKRIGLCFADLDTYKMPGMATLNPEQQLQRLFVACTDEGIPAPSLVVFSGRGLQVKWVLDAPLPAQALPRWDCVQRELTRRLKPLGSDRASIDASRVLRLVHSTHSKSGQVVRILHSSPQRFQFDALADIVLPLKREPLDDRSAERRAAARPGRRPRTDSSSSRRTHVDEAANDHHVGFTGAQLAWDRLGDVRRLATIRNWDSGAPDNWRDCAVFIGACLLAQAIPSIRRLDREVHALASEFAPAWADRRVTDVVSAVMSRARASSEGERIEWCGRAVDPRYRFRNETLVDWLEVTTDEQTELKCLIGPAEARRRDTERARRVRRASGAMERNEYLQRSVTRAAEGARLRAEGLSWADVASRLGFASAASARGSISKKLVAGE